MPKQKPSVTVIIPARNASSFIKEALDSVYAQTVQPLEVIVVNDHSTDDTVEVVQKHFPKVRLLHSVKHGVAAARNMAIREAKGDYIANLDADDVWLPTKLEMQLRMCDPSTIVGAYAQNWRGDTLATKTWEGAVFPKNPIQSFSDLTIGGGQIPGSSWMIPRLAAKRVGNFNEAFQHGEDHELFGRMILNGCRIIYVEETLVMRRLHPNSHHSSGYASARLSNWPQLIAADRFIKKHPELIRTNHPDISQMLALTLWRFILMSMSDILFRAPFKWWLPFQQIGICIWDGLSHPIVWRGAITGMVAYAISSSERQKLHRLLEKWQDHRRYLRSLKSKNK